ncbi:MAG: AraC family transcriptional regulator [Lachnospiraceae bacterium]|nr:AraC family transcriptional regulator [Lachnospiraceae bacterium]
MKKKQEKLEFRYYEIPQNQPLLALLGEKWVQNYGHGIDFLHFHNYLEIGYCYGGTGELILDEVSRRFEGNMYSVIPKNYPHTTNSDANTISRWEYLFVDVENFLHDVYRDNPLFAEDLIKRINSRPNFISEKENADLGRMILNICDEMRYKQEFYVETVRGMLQSLLLGIARINKTTGTDKIRNQMTSITQIAEALDYVSYNFHKEITIGELAGICHMSETHFRRLFERNMNMTPVDYVNLVRVQMACEYMKKHQDPMETVAIKCGFQTTSTFNRNFKKTLGITPYQWKSHPENYEGKLLNYKISALKGW